MASKVGKLIKEARLAADLTQEKLAKKVGGGLTASDISKAERGDLELPLATLRKIAKATGVTQASLVNAAQGKTTEKKTTAKKATTKKTTTAKKAEEKKAKTPASANKTMKVTATEQKLINAYRLADSATKKAAMNLLQGESNDLVNILLGSAPTSSAKDSDSIADMIGDAIGDMIGDAIGSLLGGK